MNQQIVDHILYIYRKHILEILQRGYVGRSNLSSLKCVGGSGLVITLTVVRRLYFLVYKITDMGFLHILRKMKQKEKEMRILILGLDNAGKTTILKRLNNEDISTISPTLGFNIKTLYHSGFTLNMWDVGGQKSLRSYWKNYFESTDGLIWVVDSVDGRRLDSCRKELHELLQEERLVGASLLLLANKQDLPGALTLEQIKDVLDLGSIKTHHWQIVSCSAVTGEHLVDGINWLVNDISSRIFQVD